MRRAPLPYLTARRASFIVLLGSLALFWIRPVAYRYAVRGLGVLLALTGCSMLWMIPQLLYQGLRTQRADVAVPVLREPSAGTVNPASAGGRIVWLLFDELSYGQTFEHRFPGLAMPAFDSFKSKSILFSDLGPAGYYTDRVIPSFFLGAQVDNIRSNLDGDPIINISGTRWRPFDARATIFADAKRLGWTTGVVGWYNPYCRILAGTLDYCYWRMGDGQTDGALPELSAWRNALVPVEGALREFRHEASFAQAKHSDDLAAILPQAEGLFARRRHPLRICSSSVPHPPGIYDRRTGQDGSPGSYIDNLALADKLLGEFMSTLDATSSASKTTIIVSSDHSWRVPMWRISGSWTREDEAASRGRFDPRPVLMIHSPGQQQSRVVTEPFASIRVHDMLERLLRGEQPLS